MRTSWVGPLVLAALLGCSTGPPRVGEKGPTESDSRREQAYREVLARYTARQEIYAGLDTRVLAAATYQSWPFREARARRTADFLAMPAGVLEQSLQEERAESSQWHEFFFGAHVNDPHFADFEARNSIWRIALVTEGGEVTPIKIERLGRSNLNFRALYPYLDDFWVAYKIRFPASFANGTPVVPEGTSVIRLKVASSLGKAEFTFPAQ